MVEQITFATNGTTVMTTTKGYDFVNRLTNTVTLDFSLQTLDVHAYAYNTANQRTSVTNVDGSYWVYQYDTMGQVTSGKKYWSDGSTVAGQQFDYSFDDIGNRKTTTRDTRQATYAANTLNQYTGRTVPGYVNVLGTATNAATVSLWSPQSTDFYTATTRKGDYFRGEMPFNNSTGTMWLTITNVAAISNYTTPDIVTNTIGKMLVAKTPEYFTYDADGNLTNDSLWIYTWNGENRRVTVESRSTLPTGAKMKEVWTHLADGRWIERIVSTNSGTAYFPAFTNRYVWDNQVLLAVLDHTNGLVLSFMRGLDLSGSIQGAGGVGGVLAVKTGTPAQCGTMTNTTHFTCYDGNGNVTALVKADSGELTAQYEYGAFAERLRETGPMAKLNPIRFSTQYADDVTGDVKYLHRDYTAETGRWLVRDPVAELGFNSICISPHPYAVCNSRQQCARSCPTEGTTDKTNCISDTVELNSYAFVKNAPVHAIDYLGLVGRVCFEKCCNSWALRNFRIIPETGGCTLNTVAPGQCYDADALYMPGFAIKVNNAGTINVYCRGGRAGDGSYSHWQATWLTTTVWPAGTPRPPSSRNGWPCGGDVNPQFPPYATSPP